MNAKTVLKKLMTLLQTEEEALTYAKLKDGTIVESPTFDVGEPLEVVSEDGSKSPAPDGEHELVLRDESGNENIIKVITKDGEIVERENVELADMEIKEAEDIPASNPEDAPIEMEEETYETSPGDIPSTGDGVPADVDQGEIVGADKDIAKLIEELTYRIDEMEKKIKMQVEEEVVDKEADIEEHLEEEEDEEELPKLDGAPTEAKKFSILKEKTNTERHLTAQERVLSKLYKK